MTEPTATADVEAAPGQVEAVRGARERFVSNARQHAAARGGRGATAPGSSGRTAARYLDFAGGIGCQNLGHGPDAVVEAIHAQVDRYLHQCFMVGDVRAVRGGLPAAQRALPRSAGAIARACSSTRARRRSRTPIKIARAATGRPAVIAFDRAFHGRTLLTMSLTSKVRPYKRGFGPFAPEIYRAPAPVRVPGHLHGRRACAACASSSRRTSTPSPSPA